MTRVCLVGDPDVTLQYELLSRETSRDALATYDLERPFDNSLAVRTVSVGAAVSLLNDLQWYIVRFVEEALVQEPSVSDEEWLSRPLAEKLRNGEIEPGETGEFCKIYGLERVGDTSTVSSDDPEVEGASNGSNADGVGGDDTSGRKARSPNGGDDGEDAPREGGERADAERGVADAPKRLVEPLYVRRTNGSVPEYDLREVEETLVVRVTEAEFSP